MYSRCSRYFKGSPADRESDSALAELLSGNTLADQSSLLRWMLFVLDHYLSFFFAGTLSREDREMSARSSLASARTHRTCLSAGPLHFSENENPIHYILGDRSFTHTHTHI